MGLNCAWLAARRAAGCEDGGITFFSLFLFLMMVMAAGLALDVNHAVQARNQLQGAADAAGHAALYWRYRNDEASSVSKGIEVAEANMPTSIYGNVLATADVQFGDWDPATRSFTPVAGDPTAVRVTTRRTQAVGNGVTTFLMKALGKPVLDLNTVSIWDSEDGWCPGGEGMFAVGEVQLLSSATYHDGVCIHSEDRVELLQNATFDPGSALTLPDARDLVVPGGVPDPDSGINAALDAMRLNLDAFFNELPAIADDHLAPNDPVQPSYITDKTLPLPVTPSGNVTAADIRPNAVNHLDCAGPSLTIEPGLIIGNAVVVTDCEVIFGAGAGLENSTLVVLSPSSQAITAPNGVKLGASNYCVDGGGGATVVALGDVDFGAGTEAQGVSVIAGGNISIAANADGLAGIDFLAGGELDADASGTVGDCDYAPPKPFRIPVFKMVL